MPQMQNRVQETTTTGGTGTLTLSGAVTGYITFASGFSTGASLFYTIDNGTGEWEIGIGTLVTTGTLSRVTVIASSNGGALVNFGSGTKRVFCSAPTRSLVPNQDSNSGKVLTTDGINPAWTQTLNGITIGNLTAAAGAFTTLSASSTVSGTGFSTYLASPPAIGGTTPAAGNFTTLGATGNVTLGDAAGDTLTVNGTAVSTPNNLNFDSNTLFIDAGNNRIGIGTNTPAQLLDVVGGVIGSRGGSTGARADVWAQQSDYFSGPSNKGTSIYTWGSTAGGTDANIARANLGSLYFQNLSNALIWSNTSIPLIIANNAGAETVRVTAAGNVGIGTSTSSGKLTVSGVSTQNVASFLSSASGTFSTISIGRTANEFSLGTVASANQFFSGTAAGDSVIAYGTGKLFIGGGNTGVAGVLGAVFDSSGNLGIGTSSPAATAILDVQSTTKGVRFPNMTTTQKNAITPSAGTVIFDTTLAKLCVYSGAAWQTITSV